MPVPAPAQLLNKKRGAVFRAAFASTRTKKEIEDLNLIVNAAKEKADETARKEGNNAAAGEGWTAEAWLTAQNVVKTIGEVLMAPLDDQAGNSAAELAFARQFGQQGSRELLVAMLQSGKIADILADVLWPKFVELSGQGAASASELHQKFVDEAGGFELEYADLKSFFGGLEAVVGSPAVKVEAGMRREHCQSLDSTQPFKTPNYQMWTASRTEWWFVMSPETGLQELNITEWPREASETIRGSAQPREPKPISEFAGVIAEVNGRLKSIEAAEVDRTEFIGARMYTGPCFVKYNAVLRGLQSSIPFFKNSFESLCKGNKYTTTMHVINSAVVKLSKLTFASEVYRGVSGGRLPHKLRHADADGVRGGVDPAFMSTTTDRNVALMYAASSGGPGVVFSIQQGMVDRGADISWLSQYPHEREILFAPLSGLEIRKLSVAGSVLVPEVRLSINLNNATIEEVIARRRKLLKDMGASMKIEVSAALSGTGFEDASVRMLHEELQELALAQDVEWYNEEENFQEGVKMVIDAKRHSLKHEKRLAWIMKRPEELEAHALPIVKLLREKEPTVRRAALDALAALTPPELSKHTNAMVPCLRDSDESVRQACVAALGNVLKDALALEASSIGNILENASQFPYVKRASVQALAHLDAGKLQQYVPLLLQNIVDKHGYVRRAVVQALGELHAASLLPHAKVVVRALEDSDGEVRDAAVVTLGRIVGDPTLIAEHFQSILARTRHKDGGVRASCVQLLGKLEAKSLAERAPVLVGMLSDKEERVRTAAVEVMAQLEPVDLATHMPSLASMLDDSAPTVRFAVVSTMGVLAVADLTAHLPAIVRRLSDDDKSVRTVAIGTLLGKMEVTDLAHHVEAVVERMEDSDEGVRRAAAMWAMSKLDAAQLTTHASAIANALDDPILSVRRAALDALRRIDVNVLAQHTGPILRCFDDPILSVRRAAVEALSSLPPPALQLYTEQLIRKLRDPEWTMRASVIEALGMLPADVVAGDAVFNSLLEAIEDAFDGVRAAAAGVIGELEPSVLASHAAPIAQLTQHRKGAIRAAAITILDALMPDDLLPHVASIGKLIQHPADPNRFVRACALRVLAKLDEQALAPFQKAIVRLVDEEEDDDVKDAAYEALSASDPTGAILAQLNLSPNLSKKAGAGGANSPSRRSLAQQMATSSNRIRGQGSPDPSQKRGGFSTLAMKRDPSAAAELVPVLGGGGSRPNVLKPSNRSSTGLAPVMSRLPAQESFSEGPSLSRHPDPQAMLGTSINAAEASRRKAEA